MPKFNYALESYTAPDGYVYDYKDEKINKKTGEPDHLYVKYLVLGRRDSIDNYVLIEDPRNEVKD